MRLPSAEIAISRIVGVIASGPSGGVLTSNRTGDRGGGSERPNHLHTARPTVAPRATPTPPPPPAHTGPPPPPAERTAGSTRRHSRWARRTPAGSSVDTG